MSPQASRIRAPTPTLAITKTATRGTFPVRIPNSIMDATMFVSQQMMSCHFANLLRNGLRHGTAVRRPTDSPLGPSQMPISSRPGSGLDVHIVPGASLHFSANRCIYRFFYASARNNSRPDPDCSGVIIHSLGHVCLQGLSNYLSVSSIFSYVFPGPPHYQRHIHPVHWPSDSAVFSYLFDTQCTSHPSWPSCSTAAGRPRFILHRRKSETSLHEH